MNMYMHEATGRRPLACTVQIVMFLAASVVLGYERGFAPLHAGWNAVLSVTLCSSRPSNWVWLRATESKMKLLAGPGQ